MLPASPRLVPAEGSNVACPSAAIEFYHSVQIVRKAARDLRRPDGYPTEVELATRQGHISAGPDPLSKNRELLGTVFLPENTQNKLRK